MKYRTAPLLDCHAFNSHSWNTNKHISKFYRLNSLEYKNFFSKNNLFNLHVSIHGICEHYTHSGWIRYIATDRRPFA